MLAAAADRYRQQQQLGLRSVLGARRLWAGMGTDLVGSWRFLGPQLVALVTAAQLEAAASAPAYATAALGEVGSTTAASAALNAAALAGIAADGRTLGGLLYGAVTTALTDIGSGATLDQALQRGRGFLDTVVRTSVADADRVATGIEVVTRPGIAHVRMLVPPSCSRCAILAGRTYRYSTGFKRHPRCDCRMIPAPEAVAGDLTTDPRGYFDSLTRDAQDRVFTADGAQAIRDGADILKVVNVRRSAAGLSPAGRLTDAERAGLRGGGTRGRLRREDVYGRPTFVTREGVTRRGAYGQSDAGQQRVPRLMPEAIYEVATSRQQAIDLLGRFGYLT